MLVEGCPTQNHRGFLLHSFTKMWGQIRPTKIQLLTVATVETNETELPIVFNAKLPNSS